MNEMHYLISCSIFEAMPVGVLEAMATGLKPIVYSFGGAEDIFPPEYLFMTRTEFLKSIMQNNYNPREYHDYVVRNYSISENLWRYVKTIKGE